MYYLKDPETGLYFNAEINGWTSYKLTSTGYPDLTGAKHSRGEFDAEDFPLGIKIVKTKPTHNWRWACRQMAKDLAVRRKSWPSENACLAMAETGQVLFKIGSATANWHWPKYDTNATDWEVKND